MTTRELLIPRTETKPRQWWVWGWLKGAALLTVGLPMALVAGIGYAKE